MFRNIALLSLLAAGLPYGAGAVVYDEAGYGGSVGQGQRFYSTTVSAITDGQDRACMVSTGTDWKSTAEARNGAAVAAYLEGGASLDEAFAGTSPVDVATLASNTPYMAFVTTASGREFARIATGFSIAFGTQQIRVAGDNALDLSAFAEIEDRGDALIVTEPQSLDTLRAAFAEGRTIVVSARSSKRQKEAEHHIRLEFAGSLDPTALGDCLLDIGRTKRTTGAGIAPAFKLVPSQEVTDAQRVATRGMACNRDLDPNGATLVRLNGHVGGFATPLSHGLMHLDDQGDIRHAWSGDLWRLSRVGSGYQISVSNSILAQSPLSNQLEKSCTRYSEPRCATVERRGDEFIIGPCFEPFLSGTGMATGPVIAAVLPSAFSTPTTPPGGGSGGSSSSGGSSTRYITTERVVNGPDPDDPPPQAPSDVTGELSSIPILPSGLLLACLIPLGLVLARLKKATA